MTAQYYRPQREDRGRSRLLYATAIIIIIFLLDLVAGGRLRALVRLPASYAYVSLSHLKETVLMSGIFATKHSLELENARLEEVVDAYKRLDGEYALMKEENSRLRAATGLAARMPGRAAAVISSLSASAYGTFLIDVGIEEGVARGATVFTPDGFAIGTVAETSQHTALVTQFFAPSATVEAVVAGTRIVLEGQGGGNARARAPRESTIGIGDVALSPQAGAPIGVVEHLISEATGADQEVFVRIPANLQSLSLVYVGRK